MFGLFPKDAAFYELFERGASVLQQIAKAYANLVANPNRQPELLAEIRRLEHDGDEIARKTLLKVDTIFITPFDREDIHTLVIEVDDVIDAIDAAGKRIVLFKITEPNAWLTKQTEVLEKATALLAEAIGKLRDIRKTGFAARGLDPNPPAGKRRRRQPPRRPGRVVRTNPRPHRGHETQGSPGPDGGSDRRLPGYRHHHRARHSQGQLRGQFRVLTFILVIVAAALVFDFLNGFHDAANSIATVVCTRVLSPLQAVCWAAFFNFVAAFVFGTPVAKTVGNGLIDLKAVDQYVVCAGLLGAIVWNLITWWLALPTSSSHALISGYAGAAIAKCGVGVLILKGWLPVLLFIVLSPTIGFVLGLFNMGLMTTLFRNAKPRRVDKLFRRLQLVSAALYSLGHGTNDAQKTMGIIFALLVSAGMGNWARDEYYFLGRHHEIQWWIILSCQVAIGLGTLFGGWRIVRTMGSRIARLQPIGGCCAEMAGATLLVGTALSGIPGLHDTRHHRGHPRRRKRP